MKNKKVSVLIGTFNRSKLLSRVLDSILNQSYKNIEIIVVDDCSSDNTKEVLESYALEYPNHFKYLINEKNMGISYNCNRAFEISSGDYFALVGDDDYWIDIDKIQKQIDVLKNDKNIGVVGTWWQEDNTKMVIEKKPLEPQNWEEKMLSGGGIICGSTPLITKEAWEKVCGFDEKQKRGTDSDLFRRIVLSGYKAKIIYEITTSVDTNINRNRMTSSHNQVQTYQNHINSMEYNLQKLKDHYDEYPRAKAFYTEKLSSLYRNKFIINNDKKDLIKSLSYMENSIKLDLTVKKILKLIYIKFKVIFV